MIQLDLATSRRAWIPETDDLFERIQRETSDFLPYLDHNGRYADFHALRHTFITNLCKANVSHKTAQALERHNDISLTMNIYKGNRHVAFTLKNRRYDEWTAPSQFPFFVT